MPTRLSILILPDPPRGLILQSGPELTIAGVKGVSHSGSSECWVRPGWAAARRARPQAQPGPVNSAQLQRRQAPDRKQHRGKEQESQLF